MSNTSLCTYNSECKHCTPEQMRENAKELLDRLAAQCETERKRAATAIGHLRTARASEEKMKHQLNKALDIIAQLTA